MLLFFLLVTVHARVDTTTTLNKQKLTMCTNKEYQQMSLAERRTAHPLYLDLINHLNNDWCRTTHGKPTEPMIHNQQLQLTESTASSIKPIFDFEQMKRPVPDTLIPIDTFASSSMQSKPWPIEKLLPLNVDDQFTETGLRTLSAVALMFACLVGSILLIVVLITSCKRVRGQTKKTGMILAYWIPLFTDLFLSSLVSYMSVTPEHLLKLLNKLNPSYVCSKHFASK